MDEKEKRIRLITKIYYSNPKIQKAILEFAKDREVVPSYMMESFGKRPDMIQYISDIDGLVKKGATSFHASEELWIDPLSLNSDLTISELNKLRKGWDLLIDIDSKYLDISKLLTELILRELEENGVKNYGIKFSGNKGFHIIVSNKAFPKEYEGNKTSEMFPEWPRAICEYLMHSVRRSYNKEASKLLEGTKKDTIKKEALCPVCNRPAKKGKLVTLQCPLCKTSIRRKDMKVTKKRLKCIQDNCAGIFEIDNEEDYFECNYCKNISTINKKEVVGFHKSTPVFEKDAEEAEELEEETAGSDLGISDLVLVSSRHLFRMPYSLHEKTSLTSVVLDKKDIRNFTPKMADPLKVEIRNFLPNNKENEAEDLLRKALAWKSIQVTQEREIEEKKYNGKEFEHVELKNVTEEMFPQPIKKLLSGLEDGRKRGLFVLITFLKAVNYPLDELVKKIREWNEKNKPPLREGYVKSQIEWHLKQKRKILPPNYSNEAFYRDIGILDKKPETKNPLVDVKNAMWKKLRS